jgi:large subunit ribosomal protein L10
MTLTLEDKKAIVADVSEVAKSAHAVLIADYRGTTVDVMTKLRARARERGVDCRVVRNTLARIALKGTQLECISDALTGPSILAFSTKEPSAAARLFRDFIKENETVTVKKLAIYGEAYGPEHLKAIAELPTRDEALAILMSVMKAPITKFVRTAAEPAAKFVRTVSALKDKRAAEA